MSDVTVLEFEASWCGPCDQQAEYIDELRDQRDDIDIEVIDIEENMERANEYSVRSVPTIVIEVDGQTVEQMVGVTPTTDIVDAIEQHR